VDRRHSYGPIPIVVAFYDTVLETARNNVSSITDPHPIHVGKLLEVSVIEWTLSDSRRRLGRGGTHDGVCVLLANGVSSSGVVSVLTRR
jgi:hypothetical protein